VLELRKNLAAAAHRPIERPQVAKDDESQMFEVFPRPAIRVHPFHRRHTHPGPAHVGIGNIPGLRVANRVGLEANPQNFLLMHAMGPNVAGVIGSAVAAGVLLAIVG